MKRVLIIDALNMFFRSFITSGVTSGQSISTGTGWQSNHQETTPFGPEGGNTQIPSLTCFMEGTN